MAGVVFIGAWLGFLSFVADRVLMSLNPNRQRAMFVVVGMLYAFIISSFRFYSPVYFSYFLFGLLAMFLLTRRRPSLTRSSSDSAFSSQRGDVLSAGASQLSQMRVLHVIPSLLPESGAPVAPSRTCAAP